MINIFNKFKMTLSKNEQQKVEKIVLETKTEIPDDFEFNEEFQRAFNLMENTKEHIFITGKAGTGKSTLLQYFRTETKKSIAVLAPTGVAAIKIRGQTIHSFFKFPPRFIQKDHIRRLRNKELLQKIDTIIIDEMSMLRADLLDGIDYALRINRGQHDLPFGGVQIILFGDLFQLPPVVDRDIRGVIQKLYKSPYFFSANVIKEINLKYVELHKIYRQKDENFIRLLNKIRVKQVDESDLKYLNERVNPNVTHESGVVTLTTTNSDANTINESCLAKITHKEFRYNAHICGKFDETSYPAEVCLTLKKGAQVILIKNDRDKRWVNGTIAEIADLSETHIEVRIEDNICKVPKVSWEKIEYIYNPIEEKIKEKVIGSFEQYPIKLAWAITIHKSQGQTFKDIIIDMGYGAFTHGQTYVALSRCTSLEGIILKRAIIYSDIIFDNRVYEFSNSYKFE
ncbi:MAG: DEAD/DEAH box helicase [Omnitrophica bacterium]|nr:DEAD/DEAH box helicase [Candidatus Omnitrophota bacterium]